MISGDSISATKNICVPVNFRVPGYIPDSLNDKLGRTHRHMLELKC